MMEPSGSGISSYSKANSVQVALDLKFLIEQCRAVGIVEQIRARFARAGIVFLAFYFEALANALFDRERKKKAWKVDLDSIEKRDDLPRPLVKFRAEFFKAHNRFPTGEELDVRGIQDLFLVRNQVFAHPREMTTVQSSDESLLTRLNYHKFEPQFPHFYGDFGSKHFETLLSEARTFLVAYADLMTGKVPLWLDQQFRSSDLN